MNKTQSHSYIERGFKCPTCGKQNVWLFGAGWECHSCEDTGRITFFRDKYPRTGPRAVAR